MNLATTAAVWPTPQTGSFRSRGGERKEENGLEETGRLVRHADGSIDAAASDARRAAMTDPAKQRGRGARERKAETARTPACACKISITLREDNFQ